MTSSTASWPAFLRLWLAILLSYATARCLFALVFGGGVELGRTFLLELLLVPSGQALVYWSITRQRGGQQGPRFARIEAITKRPAVMGLGVFLLALAVYNLNGRPIGSGDTLPARLLPLALIHTGRLYLDPFVPLLEEQAPEFSYTWTQSPTGHAVSAFPIVTPIVVTPFFLPVALSSDFPPTSAVELITVTRFPEELSASVIAALSVVLVFLLLRRFATSTTTVLLTAAYAFGTETWMIGSQGLWHHGMSELLLAGVLLALVRSTPASLTLAGLLAGLLVANRPPNVLFAAAATLYLLLHQRQRLPLFLVPALVVAALWQTYNLTHLDTVFGTVQRVTSLDRYDFFGSSALIGLAGLLISPGKGLLVFAPFFVFLVGSLRAPKSSNLARLLAVFVPAAAGQLWFYASFDGWDGGSCYGSRYLTDMTPVLILALVPAADNLRTPGRWVFGGLVAFGIAVQAIGAFCYPAGWSDSRMDVWSLSDIQYVMELRGKLSPPTHTETGLPSESD